MDTPLICGCCKKQLLFQDSGMFPLCCGERMVKDPNPLPVSAAVVELDAAKLETEITAAMIDMGIPAAEIEQAKVTMKYQETAAPPGQPHRLTLACGRSAGKSTSLAATYLLTMSPAETKALNAAIFKTLGDPSMEQKAVDALSDYTRKYVGSPTKAGQQLQAAVEQEKRMLNQDFTEAVVSAPRAGASLMRKVAAMPVEVQMTIWDKLHTAMLWRGYHEFNSAARHAETAVREIATLLAANGCEVMQYT